MMNFGQSRMWYVIARQQRERWAAEPLRRREVERQSATMQAQIAGWSASEVRARAREPR